MGSIHHDLVKGRHLNQKNDLTLGTCPTSDWRLTPLYTSPSSNEDFQPDTQAYYQTIVVQSTWPAAIGLGAFLALFLVFILWRLIRLCCRSRCGGGASMGSINGPAAPRWFRGLKWCMVVLLLGTAAGSVYGFIKVNSELVDHGVTAINSVKGVVTTLLDTADSGVDAINSINTLLTQLQNLLDKNINSTAITIDLQCINPWLTNLPPPSTIETPLNNSLTAITALRPDINATADYLDILASQLPNGTYVGALPDVIAVQPAGEGLVPKLVAFYTSAASLPATENRAAMVAVRDSLAALVTNPTLSTISTAFTTGASALTAASSATQSAAVAANSAVTGAAALLAGPANDVLTVLQAQETDFEVARPCMISLIERMEDVNSTIVELPFDVTQAVDLLEQAKDGMDELLGLDAGVGQQSTTVKLSAQIMQAQSTVITGQLAVANLTATANGLTANPDVNIAALVAGMNTAATQITALDSQYQALLTLLNAYINEDPGYTSYSALYALVQSSGSTSASAATSLEQWLTDASPMFVQAQAAFDALSSSTIRSDLEQVSDSFDSIPTAAEMAGPLTIYKSAYAALPSPPGQLLDDAETQVTSLMDSVTQSIGDVQAKISQGVSDGRDTLSQVRDDTVGKIEEYQVKYEPDVRKYDTIRQAALYSLFAVALLLACVLVLSAWVNWPFMLVFSTILLLFLFTLCFILVISFTAGLKVGNDGCANLEAQILEATQDNPDTVTAIRYFLYNEGGDLKTILKQSFDVDIDKSIQLLADSRTSLIDDIQGTYVLRTKTNAILNATIAVTYVVEAIVNLGLQEASYPVVNPVYLQVKAFGCCEVLDMVGGAWCGLIICGVCVWIMCVVGMRLIAFLDHFPTARCCGFIHAEALGQPPSSSTGYNPDSSTGPKKKVQFISSSTTAPHGKNDRMMPAGRNYNEESWVRIQASSVSPTSASQPRGVNYTP